MAPPSRLGVTVDAQAVVTMQGPSAYASTSPQSIEPDSPGADGPNGKKSIGKSLITFFKGLMGNSNKASKDLSPTDNSGVSIQKAKSFSNTISPVSLSPQTSGASSSNTNSNNVSEDTLAARLAARSTNKSHSFSAGMAKQGNMASMQQSLIQQQQQQQPSPTKARKNSSLAAELDGPIGGGRQPSRTFMELRAQAQVIPSKGNQVLAVCPTLPVKMQRPVWTMKDYAIVEKMYKGYASTVFKAFCKRSGELVCLKAYDMANLCELNRFQIYREVQLHSRLQHPNIITLYGAFQQDNQVVLVQEFADGGDLFSLLHRYGGRLPEKQAVDMVLQPFLNVLNYLHTQGILHRDLKPENILFTRTLGLKLCDFGLAIDLRDERAVTRAGTLEYMAPEVLKCPFKNKPEENKESNKYYYDISVDAWAVGVLMYELLVGFPPFNDKNRPAVEDKIRQDTPRFPSNLSEGARAFIAWVLQKDPLERPTIMDMLHHPYLQSTRKPPAQPAAQQAAGGASASAGLTMAQAAARAKAKGPIPSLVEDDAELSVIRPKNTMQSFTAGKAPQITNKAVASTMRHMELPNTHLHLQQASGSPNHSPNQSPVHHVNGMEESEDSMPALSGHAKSPLSALKPSGSMVSRTASVPQMAHMAHLVHVKPSPLKS